MILYDSETRFIGISPDSLSFLGYADMDELKKYTDDVANFFVKKSGYIYKFDDFSWIEYLLYGGSNKKSAIVKLKNGTFTEVELVAKEIFVFENSAKKFYQVDLIKRSKKSPKTQENDEKIEKITPTKPIYQEPKIPTIKKEISTHERSIFENLSKEDEEFLRSYALPHDPKPPKKSLKQTKDDLYFIDIKDERNARIVKEFFEYADMARKQLVNVKTNEDFKTIREYGVKLSSICEILGLNALSRALNELKNCNEENLKAVSENFSLALIDAKKDFDGK